LADFSFQDISIRYDREVTDDDLAENPFIHFSKDEDRLYAYCMFKYTYGFWDITRNELRNSPFFLFNWAVHTRTNLEI